ncbi:exonuclease SbcCD subunit D [Mycolicibacillus parakoreensis]|uniref:Exonuclease SbcCD subunit D n=1 Tax=Mycolicibacillus parakoreensis TaxID=1069221 RepID=A0ABY3U838_9MYCO|nr:exonuclease SbcCD subunit D [Mycolicibacillus parakoreensis]MCV7314963.1 exonuclease SbcCD subunit D [Mycolicibacillus parakoreensis]ULN53667.1 exonuclease SbcCD subunit D [Mycolicibacillus parakoreensis]
MLVVHAADIHLDSPLRGLSRIGDDRAQELRRSTRRALENLVAMVVDRGADLLVIAGDLYDGGWHDFGTGQFFIEQMSRLNDEGIPVVIASGNHDAESQITRSLTLPPGVHLLDTHQPQSIVFDDLGAVVHGQGYAQRDVQTNLAAAYPSRVADLVNIGVLHTAATGSPDHDTYAPCSVADLAALRYDYLALGHIHQRGPVVTGEFPAHFSGNLQGRNPRETGAKGALLVELEHGAPARVGFEALDVARWERVEVDISDCADHDEVATLTRDRLRQTVAAADGRTLVARLEITGTTALAARLTDDEWLRADMANIATQAGAVLDKVTARVQPPAPPDPEAQRLRDAVAEAAVALPDEQVAAALRELDREIREIAGGAGVKLADPAGRADLLDRARRGLDARLAQRQA